MEIQMQATPRVNRWLPPSLLCLLGSAALWIDIPVARLARQDRFPGQLKELLENLEPFGHGGAVAVIAIVVYRLESRCRLRYSTGVLLAAFGAGLTANLLKLAVHRIRPWYIAPDVAHGLETFGEMFVSINGENGAQSFPSAHAATAMGLAIALAGYYPRGTARFLCAGRRDRRFAHHRPEPLRQRYTGRIGAGNRDRATRSPEPEILTANHCGAARGRR